MRWIDRRIGAPLCALATLWLKLWWYAWPPPTRPLRRVLFIELSEMGSTILADPAMRSVRDRNGIELYFVGGGNGAPRRASSIVWVQPG